MVLADVLAAWLGYAVIAGACIVKVPQIFLIVSQSSAEGLSEAACALDAIAASSFSYYNLLKGYPVAGWGEQGIVAVQATVVLMLVWIYRKGANRSNLKLRFIGFAIWILLSVAILVEGHEYQILVGILGSSPTAMTTISRIPQISMNWRTRQTGQLSLITFFLQFLGSVARFLTTLQLLGKDMLSLISHSVGAVLNLVVVLQIIAYQRPRPGVKPSGPARVVATK
ncbi:Mannose-P-dolichol utilization defect 1 protein homolog [Durusdinium trenchii]|uniref:Mannose-P-dolichol utilization defect 1 protein homolog n=1 Tax=Durusdinium trenchii TaxID=1381693 RepID=A0ABP0R5C7_9DINO